LTFDEADAGRLGSLIDAALQGASRRNRPPPQR